MKEIIIGSLRNLSERKLITVYAFVIMPTHIHVIWKFADVKVVRGTRTTTTRTTTTRTTAVNVIRGTRTPARGETAKASFMKFTAHEFQKHLRIHGGLEKYKVNAANKSYEFWQRDSLGIEIWSRWVAVQKLSYIHANPVSKKWRLANDALSYHYSSAWFYESGIDEFGFLNNIFFVFDGE